MKSRLFAQWWLSGALGIAWVFAEFYPWVSTTHCTREASASLQLGLIAESLDHYRDATGAYPSETLGLGALLVTTGTFRPTLRKVLSDPWAKPMVYIPSSDNSEFRLYSIGADRRDSNGLGDDIVFPGFLSNLLLSTLSLIFTMGLFVGVPGLLFRRSWIAWRRRSSLDVSPEVRDA